MGRIRTIKPEFPQSETIGRLSRDARLLFIQLWTIADDHGRARANSRMLASLLYPYDVDAPGRMDGWLDELVGQGCVRIYEANGDHYLDIPKWLSHQRVDRPSASRFPEFRESSPRPREDAANNREPSLLDQGLEGKGKKCRKSNGVYPPAFETFWQTYPTDSGMSKSEAFKDFAKLTEEDQQKATAVLPSFKAWVAKQGKDYRTVHACRYLSQRRFEGFAEAKAKDERASENQGHYVKYGTDAGDAWEQKYRAEGKIPPRDTKGGWWFPSERP